MNPNQEFNQIVEKFGMDGLKDMAAIDKKVEIMLHRLLIVTTIAHNLYVINAEDGIAFLKRMEPMVNSIQDELNKDVENFTRNHGEV